MKKKRGFILLTVIVALVLVMAISVSAFAVGGSFSTGVGKNADSAKIGDTVSFTATFKADAGTLAAFQAGVTASPNLQFVSASGSSSLNVAATERAIVIEGAGVNAIPAGGSVIVTYKYKVLSGTSVSFGITNAKGFDENGDAVTYAGGATDAVMTITEAPVPTADPTPTAAPTGEPTTAPTGEPTTAPTAAPTATTDSKLDNVPKTGDARVDVMIFAVIALAAVGTIGVVAGKKVFSK